MSASPLPNLRPRGRLESAGVSRGLSGSGQPNPSVPPTSDPHPATGSSSRRDRETEGKEAGGAISAAFARAKAEGRTALMPFVTAGYPSIAMTERLVPALVRGGADIIELGVPFSDPLADGATVQRTSQVALANGVRLIDCLALARRLRTEHDVRVPLVLMGYYNPILQYGPARFAADAAAAGVDGFIVPDLPTEESDELLAACRAHHRDLIFLLAPTSTDERIADVARRASGFIYCVSLTGVTGARQSLPDLSAYLARVRHQTDLPIAIGFGVSSAEMVRQIGAVADGAVFASAMIDHLDTLPEAEQPAAAEAYVRAFDPNQQKAGDQRSRKDA